MTTTHKWKDIERKRDQRIARLIAQARAEVEAEFWADEDEMNGLLLALAAALEAIQVEMVEERATALKVVEAAEADAEHWKTANGDHFAALVAEREAVEAERDAERVVIERIAGETQQTIQLLQAENRRLAEALAACPMPSTNDMGVWWDYWQLTRAALAGVAPPEEQP